MILLKAAVLFFLVALSFGYPLTDAEAKKECGIGECSYYIANVPKYITRAYLTLPWTQEALDKNNRLYKCGRANVKGVTRSSSGNVTETKIIEGENAKPHEFPWQVGIAVGLGNRIKCGGSIISSKEILTAAHCIQGKPHVLENHYLFGDKFKYEECIYAVVGEHDTSKTNRGERWNRICNVQKHPEHGGNIYENGKLKWYNNHDIAVLTLCKELQFNIKVSPVCLPRTINAKGDYDQYVDNDVIASGWGNISPDANIVVNPEILQKVDLRTMSNSNCFDDPDPSSIFNESNEHKSKICAVGAVTVPAGASSGIFIGDTCQGDSGGPLVIEESNIYTLIGATSYTELNRCGQAPSVYTRVTDAMADGWLQKQITGIPKPVKLNPGTCDINNRKNNKNTRSLKNNKETTYYHFEKDKMLTRVKAEKACKSEFGGQLTSINTMDEYEWIKKQIIDLNMKGPIAIGGKRIGTGRKFEWTDKSEMDMKVLNANWFKTRNYQFPTFKNKKRVNLELWYSRRALGFANVFDHKAPTKYICKLDKLDNSSCPV